VGKNHNRNLSTKRKGVLTDKFFFVRIPKNAPKRVRDCVGERGKKGGRKGHYLKNGTTEDGVRKRIEREGVRNAQEVEERREVKCEVRKREE
jgi:hypothetical protein